MTYVHANPLSTLAIRRIANEIRAFFNLGAKKRINAPKLLDVLSFFWKEYGFQYLVLPDDDLIFGKGEEAKTDLSTGMIYIQANPFAEDF